MNKAIILLICISACTARKAESTHDLLSRLGFESAQKPGVNLHKKRVADDLSKPRYSEAYNENTDSHLYMVRVPPHYPYYSQLKPQQLHNEVVEKPHVEFASNGKPNSLYHWNMPLIRKLAKKHKSDSKIYRVKVLPEQMKYYAKLKKGGKPSLYKLKMDDMADHQNDRPWMGTKSRKSDLKDSKLTHIVSHPKYDAYKKNKENSTEEKKSKYHTKYDGNLKTPLIYSPALPKENSFFKYFSGNGKPKSFYVIEKGEQPSRFHRLL